MWKTVSARIRGAKAELEDMGEDTEGMVESTSKLRDLVKGFTGFDIMEDEKTFKSIYDIILGIGEKWNELNDIDRAALLEALAGKRAGNALAAALNNIDDLKASYETALNASGSAMREQENYEKSIQFSIDRLKATAQDLAQDFMSSDLIKNTIDFFNKVLEILDAIVEKTGDLTPFLTAIGGVFAASKIGKGMGGVADLIGGLIGSNKEIENTKKAIEGLDDDFEILDLSINKTTKSFWTSKAALGIYAAAIAATITVAKGIIDTSDRMAESAKKAGDSYKDSTKEISDYYDKIQTLQGTLHDESASIIEVAQARQDLLKIKRDLIEQYKDEPNIISSVTAAINEESGALDNLKKKLDDEAYRKALNALESPEDESFGDRIFKKLYYMIGDYGNAIDKMEKTMGSTYKTIGMTDSFPIYKQTKDVAESLGFQVKENNYGDYLSVQGDTADEVLEKLKKLQSAIGNTNEKLSISLAETITDLESEIDKYSNLWNEYILREKILGKDAVKGLADTYDELNKAAEEYNRVATEKGFDSEEAKSAAKEYSEILQTVLVNDEVDASTKEFFENMYPELKDVFDKWKFEVEVIPTISDIEKTNLRASFAQLVQDGYGDAQTINSLSLDDVGKGTVGAIGLQGLIDVSNAKGLEGDITQLVALAVKEGWISGTPDEAEFKKWAKRKGFEKQIEALSEEQFQRALTIPREAITSWETFKRLLEETDEASKAFSRSEMNDAINELSEGFDKLDEIYADITDKGSFDFAKLDTKKFKEAFDGLDEEYLNFIETVSSSPDDISKCQKAFDDLVSAYIDQSGILNHLTEQNKELVISRLKSMGVANAEEIVTHQLTQQLEGLRAEKAFVASTSKQLESATIDEINAFADEQKYSEETRQALIRLALQKQLVNGTTLNFDADISNIIGFVEMLGGAVTALQRLQDIKNGISKNLTDQGWSGSMDEKTREKQLKVDAQAEVDKVLANFRKTNTQVQYSGADKTRDAIDKANKSGEESKEIIDWIEKALQRMEEEINRIDKTVSATYKNWSDRNGAIKSEISAITREISMQQQAYESYLRDAAAIPLAEEYKKLVREGAMYAETITDKNLKKLIDQYTELYDKAIKAQDAIIDLNAKIAALAKQKFDNVKSEFEGFTSEIEHFVNMIDKELSHVEAMGKIAGKSFYEEKINKDAEQLEKLKEEREALVNALEEAESNGIEKGSADWITMRNDIYSVDEKIQELTYDMEELKQKIIEVNKLKFDDIKRQFDGYLSNIQHFRNMIDKEMSHVENMGDIAGKSFYRAEIKQNDKELEALKVERKKLMKQLEEAEKDGLEKGSPEWLEMRDAIYAIDEQIVDVKYETEELKKKMKEVSKLRFDDFKAQFEQVTQIIQNQVNSVNSVISLVEKSGHIVSTKYYENLIKLNKQNISTLHKEYNKLQKQLTKAMEKGDVKKYSNEW